MNSKTFRCGKIRRVKELQIKIINHAISINIIYVPFHSLYRIESQKKFLLIDIVYANYRILYSKYNVLQISCNKNLTMSDVWVSLVAATVDAIVLFFYWYVHLNVISFSSSELVSHILLFECGLVWQKHCWNHGSLNCLIHLLFTFSHPLQT